MLPPGKDENVNFGKKERMSSFVTRGNKLAARGKEIRAITMVEQGLQYYTEKIIKVLYPYAAADAGLIVLVLRHIADEVEKNNTGAKELAEGLKECIEAPSLMESNRYMPSNRS